MISPIVALGPAIGGIGNGIAVGFGQSSDPVSVLTIGPTGGLDVFTDTEFGFIASKNGTLSNLFVNAIVSSWLRDSVTIRARVRRSTGGGPFVSTPIQVTLPLVPAGTNTNASFSAADIFDTQAVLVGDKIVLEVYFTATTLAQVAIGNGSNQGGVAISAGLLFS
jgi:hypothetical protein